MIGDRNHVATIAQRARARWTRLIRMTDEQIAEHVANAVSNKRGETEEGLMANLTDAYRAGLISGASDLYLTGLMTATTIVAHDLDQPTPDWSKP